MFIPLMAVTLAALYFAGRSTKKERENKKKAWNALQSSVRADGSIEMQKLKAYFQSQLHYQA